MATLTAGETKAAVAPKPNRAAAQVEVAAPSRREFLYYIWGASIVLVLGETTAAIIWFALPRFKEGTFGGVFNIAPSKLPIMGNGPLQEPSGRFWVSNTDQGVVTLFGVCTHLGCLPKWSDTNFRFECPCHGSKFQLNGTYIEGPAPRNLDRFVTTIYFDDGTEATMDADGNPIPLNGKTIARIAVNTGARVKGKGHG
ncbi:MAG: Rieske 2Fe-2S domain-containing protein [Chloroflexota bacterium]|nr:Rieske 2Fe-2S domain-containing protein [Chloroflexota bacterium]